MDWPEIIAETYNKLKSKALPQLYEDRLKFEFAEIDKQGAGTYWTDLITNNKKFETNKRGLLLPWLWELVQQDPIATRKDPILLSTKATDVKAYLTKYGKLPSDIIRDSDIPDIDIDCLPEAREPIKEYAIAKYGNDTDGYGSVCSVGTWQTFKLKLSIQEAAKALGVMSNDKMLKTDQERAHNARIKAEIYHLTTNLPDEVDELKDNGMSVCKGKIKKDGIEKDCKTSHNDLKCPKCGSDETDGPTIAKLLNDYEELKHFAQKYPKVIRMAVKLVGRIRNPGKHAGALIIADRSLYGNVPMSKKGKDGSWVSFWSEGRNTQLSKFGYTKWDILGLKNLKYIFECCKHIERNRGISFGENMEGWDDIDPTDDRAGYYIKNGEKHKISLNDKKALELASKSKTDGVFQFDTPLAQSILANGVKSFSDLLLFNAMGHPGPMQSIPEAVKNRDDKSGKWKKLLHPEVLKILERTHGLLCYQEQLTELWQNLAGFTGPEAQDARKAVAKKWKHKLLPIEKKWLTGAAKTIGLENAQKLWASMVFFARYAFNLSHAVSYCLVAHKCLFLKAYYAPEWWASVMSDCHPDKLIRYMNVARAEGVKFETININNLTTQFTVTGDVVNQGLIGVKGIGENTSHAFSGIGEFSDIDDFVAAKPKGKKILERFIKLGAFKPYHTNIFATWMWYQFAYCSGKEITKLRKDVATQLLSNEGWDERSIEAERSRQMMEYKKVYPKRKVLPPEIKNWKPKPKATRDAVMGLYPHDYQLNELLGFEKEFLGYYLHSPMDLYHIRQGTDVESAKKSRDDDPILQVVINSATFAITKNNTRYCKLVVSDGVQTALVMVWQNEINITCPGDVNGPSSVFKPGTGISMIVDYDRKRNSFSVRRGEIILKLPQI